MIYAHFLSCAPLALCSPDFLILALERYHLREGFNQKLGMRSPIKTVERKIIMPSDDGKVNGKVDPILKITGLGTASKRLKRNRGKLPLLVKFH